MFAESPCRALGSVQQSAKPVAPQGLVQLQLRSAAQAHMAQRQVRALPMVNQVEGHDAGSSEWLGFPIPAEADVLRSVESQH